MNLAGSYTKVEPQRQCTSLACMFYFRISDHVVLLEGIVSFKCRQRSKRRIPMRASRGLKWENKTRAKEVC